MGPRSLSMLKDVPPEGYTCIIFDMVYDTHHVLLLSHRYAIENNSQCDMLKNHE